MIRALAAALCLSACGAAPAADYAGFGPARLVAIAGYDGDAMEPFVSADGRTLYWNSNNERPGQTDLFYARRTAVGFESRGRLTGANSSALDAVASVDAAGNLYFVSTRSYAQTLSTIYRGRLHDGSISGIAPVAGVSTLQRGVVDFDAEISRDGRTLYVVRGDFSRGGGVPRSARIAILRRDGDGFRADPASDRLLARVNSGFTYAPSLSSDERELFFTAGSTGAPPQIFRVTRARTDQPFGDPERVTAAEGFVEAPSLSADGRLLYFHKRVGDRFRLFVAAR